jgi:hypothetical protein
MSLIRRTTCAHAQFIVCSSTTNARSETGQMAVCFQNLTLGALSRCSALSLLVGALFKTFGFLFNTPCMLVIGQIYRALHRKNWVHLIAAGETKSPWQHPLRLKQYQAVRTDEKVSTKAESTTVLRYTYVASLVLYTIKSTRPWTKLTPFWQVHT